MKKEIALAVLERDVYCGWCGRRNEDPSVLHHRQLRKHGGKDEVANLVALHSECHNMGTASVHLNPAKAYERGFLVKSWQDPDREPITMSDGTKAYLSDLGGYVWITERSSWGSL